MTKGFRGGTSLLRPTGSLKGCRSVASERLPSLLGSAHPDRVQDTEHTPAAPCVSPDPGTGTR